LPEFGTIDRRTSGIPDYVAGHIAGARNAAPIPGAPASEFAAVVERLLGGDKSKALVLYCNRPAGG
jgi:rhodanese-related sulfurtransferase